MVYNHNIGSVGMKLKTRDMTLVALFAALTTVGAMIKIQIPYVPFTLQSFFCIFSGVLLGARLGALSQILYVAIGLIGLPVFADGSGPSYIFSPTFGYLIGFIVCAYVVGKLNEKVKNINFIKSYLIIICGTAFVYLFGVAHLYIILNFYLNKAANISHVLFTGCFVFLAKDFLLSIFIALISIEVAPRLKKSGLIANNL
jgi:biotin transport system substrate-specific component